MRRKALGIVAVLTLTTLAVLTPGNIRAAESLVLYDDFKGTLINPNKWMGTQSWGNGNIICETIREIQGNALHMMSNVYGVENPMGGYGFGNTQLRILNPNPVTAMKAKLKIAGYKSVGLPDVDTAARVRFMGVFFNAGSTTPSSSLDDVGAGIQIYRPSSSKAKTGVLDIVAFAWKCTDTGCFNNENLFPRITLGTVKVGTSCTISVEWDKANNRFGYQLNKNSKVYGTYSVSDSTAPYGPNRRIGVDNYVANYTTKPANRPMAFMDAYIDEVYVNQSALADGSED